MKDTTEFSRVFWGMVRIAGRPRTVQEFEDLVRRQSQGASVDEDTIQALLDGWCESGHVTRDSRGGYQVTRKGLRDGMPVSEKEERAHGRG